MYLPSDLFDLPYRNLVASRHAASPPLLLLVALEPDALCASRIFTSILKRDYIPHNIVPVSGYEDLERAGLQHVQPMRLQSGGSGGTVVCLGTGGMVDLTGILGFDATMEDEDAMGGVEIWVFDARRPWNLGNVFGGNPSSQAILTEISGNARQRNLGVEKGQIQHQYKSSRGGVIVFDDGDIGQLEHEQTAYLELEAMPDIEDDGQESDSSESGSEDGDDSGSAAGRKRKSRSEPDEDIENDTEDDRPRQRRRSNSRDSIPVTPRRERTFNSSDTLAPDSQASPAASTTSTIAPPSGQPQLEKEPSMRQLRRRLLRKRRAHEAVLHAYYARGSSYSEPISSLLYRLASSLGHVSNDMLWLTCVGVTSVASYGRCSPLGFRDPNTSGDETVLTVLRDEVNRLNPPDKANALISANSPRYESEAIVPTHARSPTDSSIRLSPEPQLLLLRHWSLYDAMLHSPYLAARLRLWSEPGRKSLNKLLAKMGISLVSARQSYTHMDVEAKRNLRSKLLKYGPVYGIEDLIPPAAGDGGGGLTSGKRGWGFVRNYGWKASLSASDASTIVGAILEVGGRTAKLRKRQDDAADSEGTDPNDASGRRENEEFVRRFWAAYDALDDVSMLLAHLPATMALHRAILRTGTALLAKHQIRHLRAFRMAVVKDGPDVATFAHPGALTKLAVWLDAVIGKEDTPLVLAGLHEARGVYVVVGLGGGTGVVDVEQRKNRRERMAAKKARKEEQAKEKARARAERRARNERERARRQQDGEEDEGLDELESEPESDESEEEDDDDEEDGGAEDLHKKGQANRFGVAFQEVIDEVGATTRLDNFENCVIEVKKEDLQGFLEALSMKAVVG